MNPIQTRINYAAPAFAAEPKVKFEKPVLLDPNSKIVRSLFPKLSDLLNVVRAAGPGGPEPKPIEFAPSLNARFLGRMTIR